MSKEENTYSTTDFYTTAVLVYKKFEVVKITTDGNGKGRVKRFHFNNSPELQDTIMQYMNGKLEGNLRDFRNSIETVKDMVHSG